MKVLNFNNNLIEKLNPKAFWSSYTNYTTLHNRLEILNLNDNNIYNITKGTFDPLYNLKGIFLSRNKLSSLEVNLFINLPTLKVVDLSSNLLLSLPTQWLPKSLSRLNIQFNRIKQFTIKTFQGATGLIELRLSPRKIQIEYNIFNGLPSLAEIKVTNNTNNDICSYWYVSTLNYKDMFQLPIVDKEIRDHMNKYCYIPG